MTQPSALAGLDQVGQLEHSSISKQGAKDVYGIQHGSDSGRPTTQSGDGKPG